MEGSIYSNLGLKKNRTFRDQRDELNFGLKDVLEHKFTILTKEELKKIFINDLKKVLLKETIFQLITAFFELESDLQNVLDQLDFELDINFDEFYKNLSPLLMRSLLENENTPNNAEKILRSLKESMRIALEAELYQIRDHF